MVIEAAERGHAERGHAERGHAERGHAVRGHAERSHAVCRRPKGIISTMLEDTNNYA